MAPFRLALPVAATLGCWAAYAAEEIATHAAHEHGVATLNVAIEADRVELELDSPAMNVIGFEHAPRTDKERAAATRARSALQNAERAFVLTPAAECRASSVDVTAPEWGAGNEHTDYVARYSFRCARADLLRSIDVRILNELAQGTKLHVQVVAAGKQTSAELARGRSAVSLR